LRVLLALIRPGDVYRAALHLAAAAVVFIHNHPSGDPMPSQEDQEITRRLKECGEMLAIRVLDHVILGADRYYSFSDRGLLWSSSKLFLSRSIQASKKRLAFFLSPRALIQAAFSSLFLKSKHFSALPPAKRSVRNG
jgi:RadC-like JAB domain